MKTNFGHLESASGILGFIKAVLVCHHGVIPPSLHFDSPSRHIDFDALKIAVVTKPQDIPHDAVVGVNSFGFGGANAHVSLRSVRNELDEGRHVDNGTCQTALRISPDGETIGEPDTPTLIAFSADSPAHLAKTLESYLPLLRSDFPLPVIASSLVRNRSLKRYRRTFVGASNALIVDQISDVLDRIKVTGDVASIAGGGHHALALCSQGRENNGQEWVSNCADGVRCSMKLLNVAKRSAEKRSELISRAH